MSLNFSIDSILGHEDQEASSSSGRNSTNGAADLTSMAGRLSQFHRNLSVLSSSFESPSPASELGATLPTLPTLNQFASSSASGPPPPPPPPRPLHYDLAQLTQLGQQLSPFGQLARFQYLQKVHSLYAAAAAAAAGTSGLLLSGNASALTSSLIGSGGLRSSEASPIPLALDNAISNPTGNDQCSPVSDRSLEILLQYEDSEDNALRAGRFLLSNQRQFEQMHKLSGCSSNSSESSASDNGQSASELMARNSMFAGELGRAGDCDSSAGRYDTNANESDNGDGNSASTSGGQFGKQDKDAPLCTKCKLHGIRNEVRGHKKKCPMKDCGCELCVLTDYGKRLRGKKAKKVVPEGPNNTNSTSGASLLFDSLAANVRSRPTLNANDRGLSGLGLSSATLPSLEMLSGPTVQDRSQLIVNLLKERLQQDGLDFDQEVCRLKDSIVYLLLGQFDKSELHNKFIVEM
jgi:hypothetical protein